MCRKIQHKPGYDIYRKRKGRKEAVSFFGLVSPETCLVCSSKRVSGSRAFGFEVCTRGIELVRNVHRFASLVTFAAPTELRVDCLLTTTGVREDLSSPSKPCGVTFVLWVSCSPCKKARVFLGFWICGQLGL